MRRNPLAKVLLPVSSVYDRHDSMDGMDDDNFYLKNPVDYIATSWSKHLSSCENMAFQTKAGLISLRKQLSRWMNGIST